MSCQAVNRIELNERKKHETQIVKRSGDLRMI